MFSELAGRSINTPNQGTRSGARVDHIILHHAAGTNLNGVLNMIATASRRVSYNYIIGPTGEIVGVVSENNRSWSVANAHWDSRSITICHINSSAGGSWPVSDAAHEASARLVADICRRRGIPVNRDRIFGHRELWTRHRAGYATACPGGLNMDRIVTMAVADANLPTQRRHDMQVLRVVNGTLALVGEFTNRRFTSTTGGEGFSLGSNRAAWPEVSGLTEDQVATLGNEANARRAALVREISQAVLSALAPGQAAAPETSDANPGADE
jgi:hypothetical protein